MDLPIVSAAMKISELLVFLRLHLPASNKKKLKYSVLSICIACFPIPSYSGTLIPTLLPRQSMVAHEYYVAWLVSLQPCISICFASEKTQTLNAYHFDVFLGEMAMHYCVYQRAFAFGGCAWYAPVHMHP